MKSTGPKVKISRRLSLPLTAKAGKYMGKKPYPPGQHGEAKHQRRKVSDYKRHLLEKQRLRAQYNIDERQMRNYVHRAIQKKGNPGDNLIQMLESRLDALVYRSGFARTIYAARQYVSHRHILLNGRWVSTPAQQVGSGDIISVRPRSRELQCFKEAVEEMVSSPSPYLDRSKEEMTAKLLYLPKREEVSASCEMSLVIEYYSK